jgi:predicted histidine transporter YuiF (NhaC family)
MRLHFGFATEGADVAELVTIDGQRYTKRDPLGVLGLSFITIGIYWFYWYFKVNEEIRRFEKDDSVRPGIALLAVTLGWIIIAPPFLSVYNTSKHVVRMQERAGVQQMLSPALNIVLLLVFGIAIGLYTQEHLNKVWDAAARRGVVPPPPPGEIPPPPV